MDLTQGIANLLETDRHKWPIFGGPSHHPSPAGSQEHQNEFERWLTLPDSDRAVICTGAGLTWQEALSWERDRQWDYDLDALATLAALRGTAA